MKWVRMVAVCVLCLSVFGCRSVSTSENKLLSKPGGRVFFEAPISYQAAYRIAKKELQDYSVTWLGHRAGVDSDLFTDAARGVIVYRSHNAIFGATTFVHVDVKSLAPHRSEVTIHHQKHYRKTAEKIKQACLEWDQNLPVTN